MSTHDFKIFTAFERPRYLTSMGNKTGAPILHGSVAIALLSDMASIVCELRLNWSDISNAKFVPSD